MPQPLAQTLVQQQRQLLPQLLLQKQRQQQVTTADQKLTMVSAKVPQLTDLT